MNDDVRPTPTGTAMLAFTNTQVTKAQLIASLERHRAADRIVQGVYWEGNGDGRGCAVGCSVHDFAPGHETDHAQFEPLFGIPLAVARLEDQIFEGLPIEDARDWPLRFAHAVPEGADLSRVVPAVLVQILERRLAALDGLDISAALRSQVADAIEQVLAVVRAWRDTGVVDQIAAKSARSAAWSAAKSAAVSAWSAAWSAARSAAVSAVRSAESAESAAWSARSAAWSAAKSAEYRWLADVLIEETQGCASGRAS